MARPVSLRTPAHVGGVDETVSGRIQPRHKDIASAAVGGLVGIHDREIVSARETRDVGVLCMESMAMPGAVLLHEKGPPPR